MISQKPLNILLKNSACLFDTYFSKVRLNLIKFKWRAPKQCHPEVKQCYFHFNRQLLTAISNKLMTKTAVLGLGLNDDNKMRIQTLRELGMGYRNNIARFPDKNWKICTVQSICWRVDKRGSTVKHKPWSGRPRTVRTVRTRECRTSCWTDLLSRRTWDE